MVLSILIATVTAPGLLGTQEAIRQSQAKEKREEHRARRCNLIATCVKSSMRSREINGRPIVLKDGKVSRFIFSMLGAPNLYQLYIDTGTSDGGAFGHQYAGYYLPYPDEKYEGLVTTITDEAPIMNWVYIDKETYEVKYGVRLNAQPNLTGPFDCTRQDRRLTFDGWEGWCAVEEFPTIWSLYFDKDDDGLRSKVTAGTRVLEIELSRKEKRWKKESDARQEDQTTQRAVDAKEDAPVDKPVINQPQPANPLEKSEQEPLATSLPNGQPKPLREPMMMRMRPLFTQPNPQINPDLNPFLNPQPSSPVTPVSEQQTPLSEHALTEIDLSAIRSNGMLQPSPFVDREQPQSEPEQPQMKPSFRHSNGNIQPPPLSTKGDASFESQSAQINSPFTQSNGRPHPAAVNEDNSPPKPEMVQTKPLFTPSNSPPQPPRRTSSPKSSPTSESGSSPSKNKTSSTLARTRLLEAMSANPPPKALKEDKVPPLRPSTANTISSTSDPRASSDAPSAYSLSFKKPAPSGPTSDSPTKPQSQPTDPAIFGGITRDPPPRSVQRTTQNPISESPTRTNGRPSAGPTRSSPFPPAPSSPERRRPISPDKRRPVTPKRSATTSTRSRGASTSSQTSESARALPKVLSRTNTAPTAPGRVSMAAAMTTGEKGAMHSSPALSSERPGYQKTTSVLYKEIDDILKPGRGATGQPPPSRGSQVGFVLNAF